MKASRQVYANAADQYGFGRYSIVLHAPAATANEVQRFRVAIGIAHMTTEPHVSIVSHLFALQDREKLLIRLRDLAAELAAIRVTFAEPLLHLTEGGAVARIVASAELIAMRDATLWQLPGVVSMSQSPDASWQPHLTVYQSNSPEVRAKAERLSRTLNLGSGFEATSLDLVGRLGTPPDGIREIIATIPLSTEASINQQTPLGRR
ncbi:MAG: 2'-5' RNA ligase family protein [Pseudomonadota bacterium]